jgi:hypothetical protein
MPVKSIFSFMASYNAKFYSISTKQFLKKRKMGALAYPLQLLPAACVLGEGGDGLWWWKPELWWTGATDVDVRADGPCTGRVVASEAWGESVIHFLRNVWKYSKNWKKNGNGVKTFGIWKLFGTFSVRNSFDPRLEAFFAQSESVTAAPMALFMSRRNVLDGSRKWTYTRSIYNYVSRGRWCNNWKIVSYNSLHCWVGVGRRIRVEFLVQMPGPMERQSDT